MNQSREGNSSGWFWASGILLIALLVRLSLFTGLVRGDDVNYAVAAYELSQGRTHFDRWQEGTERIGLYVPVAIIYKVFGVSDFSTVAFPLVASLLTTFLVFLLGKDFFDFRTGLVAGLLWAVFPLDIFLATDLLPDGPLTALSTAAVYCAYRAEITSERWRKVGWGSVALIALVWAILVKPSAVTTGFYLAIFFAWRRLQPLVQNAVPRVKRSGIIAAFAGGLLLLFWLLQPPHAWLRLSNTATDLSTWIVTGRTNQPSGDGFVLYTSLFFVFGPLMLVSLIQPLSEKLPRGATLFWWAVFGLIYYEWGTFGTNPLNYSPLSDWVDGRNLLYVMPPVIILCANYLTRFLAPRNFQPMIALTSLLVTVTVYLMSWKTAEALVLNILAWSAILAVLLIIASVAWRDFSTRPYSFVGGLLLASVFLGALHPAPPFAASHYTDRQLVLEALSQLPDIIGENPQTLVVDPTGSLSLVDYVFGFRLGHSWMDLPPSPGERFRVVSFDSWSSTEIGAEAYLVDFGGIDELPAAVTLIHEATSGETVLFRVYRLGEGQ